MNLSPLRRILDASCKIYAACTLLLCAGQLLFAADGEIAVNPLSFFMLFPFAVCFAGANLIWASKTISPGMRFLGHFALLSTGVILFIFLPAGVFDAGRSALLMVSAYLLLYFLSMLVMVAVRSSLRRRKAERTSSYTPQYKNTFQKK